MCVYVLLLNLANNIASSSLLQHSIFCNTCTICTNLFNLFPMHIYYSFKPIPNCSKVGRYSVHTYLCRYSLDSRVVKKIVCEPGLASQVSSFSNRHSSKYSCEMYTKVVRNPPKNTVYCTMAYKLLFDGLLAEHIPSR